jgi:phospholipase/carboxylesterase
MSDPFERIQRILPPLLRTLETLQLIARYLNPPELASMLESIGPPDNDLRAARTSAEPWPEAYSGLGAQLDLAADNALKAFDGLRASAQDPGSVGEIFRAMRHIPKAMETLYPLAGLLPPVNRFFLDAAGRKDEALQRKFLDARGAEANGARGSEESKTGIIRFGDDPDARQTVYAYVPETYSPDVAHPLVMALHGGSGRGRYFLWSWLRDARSRGAIVVAPTSLGQTWAIQGDDRDSPHLAAILDFVRGKWNVDASRMMLTGMSDGGTFSYVSGLEASSPFTHLAPVAAAFHPMLVQMADVERLKGLPIHIIHGVEDWMFHVGMAREAERYFQAAGAAVVYSEVADLSHTYPSDMNGAMLDWLAKA